VNPLLRTLETRVLKIQKKVVDVKKKNATKKGKTTGEVADETEWEIECEDTGAFWLNSLRRRVNLKPYSYLPRRRRTTM
jgi:hypothetical protein